MNIIDSRSSHAETAVLINAHALQHYNLLANYENKHVEHEDSNINKMERVIDGLDANSVLNTDIIQDDGNTIFLNWETGKKILTGI